MIVHDMFFFNGCMTFVLVCIWTSEYWIGPVPWCVVFQIHYLIYFRIINTLFLYAAFANSSFIAEPVLINVEFCKITAGEARNVEVG
jgi:hypothetical protein